ncbi:MAG: hypothetical protein SV377_04575 [Halobacteria archaeon]|nr:hypothetical protein [Halobacteria archaeon]
MDLDQLREIQTRERRRDALQELRDPFYSEVASYIQELSEKRDSLDDPYSEEAQQVNDQLQTARQVTEAIYEKRIGKIVKLASLSANGVSVNESGMTPEETELFDSIVDEIKRNHEFVVDPLLQGEKPRKKSEPESGEEEKTAETQTETKTQTRTKKQTSTPSTQELSRDGDDPQQKEPEPQDILSQSQPLKAGNPNQESDRVQEGKGSGSLSKAEADSEVKLKAGQHHDEGNPVSAQGNNATQDGYTTVRVLDDLPEFMGTDGRSYSLSKEDVVVLPEKNANVLCEKEAAVKID